MSRVYFHFQEGPVLELRGAERAYLGHIVANAAFGAIGMVNGSSYGTEDALNGLAPFLGPQYAELDPRTPYAADKIRFAIGSSFGGEQFSYKGKTIKSFALMLNTAIVFGSDAVALAAKIYATCEIHGYFLGKDRAWLADLIDQAVETNVFRRAYWAPRDRNAELKTMMNLPVTEEEAEYVEHSMGWTEIAEQLRKSDEGAVVMSYSITDGFPEMPEGWEPKEPLREPENDHETRGDIKREMFSELPEREKFDLSFAEVQQRGDNLPISPDTLRAELFQHELSLLDLMRHDIPKIERKLGMEES